MPYSNPINDKIKQLIAQREEIDRQIQIEEEKERAKYKFSWKRFLLILAVIIVPALMIKTNDKIFPKDSIWSWHYYFK